MADWADYTTTGLRVHWTPSRKEFREAVDQWLDLEQSVQFSLGDAYNLGEDLYGDEALQDFDWRRISAKTLENYARVCRKVPRELRNPDVSFSHHAVLVKLPPDRIAYWLDRAVQEYLSEDMLQYLTAEERGVVQSPPAQCARRLRTLAEKAKLIGDQVEVVEAKNLIRTACESLEDAATCLEKPMKEAAWTFSTARVVAGKLPGS